MKHSLFELSSEQTLGLEELRKVLVETLPSDAAKTVELPVASFACVDCGTSTCIGSCLTSCSGHCIHGCNITCTGFCKPGCGQGCGQVCTLCPGGS